MWRSAAIGGDINTQFTGIPLQHSNAAQLSEFYGSGRQSRLALKATGKLASVDMTGYYEMDWLGTGITSNNNQSNSYVVRQRQLWARAAFHSGWNISGGQMWTLATETTHGLDNGTEILPAVIDPQYVAGFVWARQYGFRVTKDFGDKIWIGASAENAETLNPAGSSLPTNLLIGSDGNSGGLYNVTANYSFNLAPDMIAKVAFEPGFGHYEVFGIARFFRDRIYPNMVVKTTVNGVTTVTGTSAGAYNDSTVGGGIGASGRATLLNKKLTVGLKGLWGDGTGRYGSSTIADITLRPNAQIAVLHNFDALGTIEANPTQRLNLYLNYGGDYIGRRYFGKVGYGSPLTNMSGCNTEPLPSTTVNTWLRRRYWLYTVDARQLRQPDQGRPGASHRLLVRLLPRTHGSFPSGHPIQLLPAQHLVWRWWYDKPWRRRRGYRQRLRDLHPLLPAVTRRSLNSKGTQCGCPCCFRAASHHRAGVCYRYLAAERYCELVAQLVEQRTFNAWVLGSIPSELTNRSPLLPFHANNTFHIGRRVRHRAATGWAHPAVAPGAARAESGWIAGGPGGSAACGQLHAMACRGRGPSAFRGRLRDRRGQARDRPC